MNILVENISKEYQTRVDYVLDFITAHPTCPEDVVLSSDLEDYDLKTQYGGEFGQGQFYIPRQKTIFSTSVHPTKSLRPNEYQWNDRTLYSVEKEKHVRRNFIEEGSFQFDMIEMIFFHLSRYEEYNCVAEGRDRWDMMKESDQFLVKYGLEKKPVVDHLVICLLEALGVKLNKQKTTIRITHDIDLITKFKSPLSFLRFNAYYLKNGRGMKAMQKLWGSYFSSVFSGIQPYDVFDTMLIENSLDREIYFLMGGKTTIDTPLDAESDIFKNAVKLCQERGYKIGIHPSYATWTEGDLLTKEKEILENVIGEEITISRQHYLHFSFDKTISILEDAGIKQDSTIGFNQRIGFRAGTGVGFMLYDHTKDRASQILEKPLVLMDSSLFEESNFEPDMFADISNKFIDDNEFYTELTCNFHNSRFDDANMFGLPQEELYKKLTIV